MKSGYYKFVFTVLSALLVLGIGRAQYDDIYFDPEDNTGGYYIATNKVKTKRVDEAKGNNTYDYYYTSRIRRFDRPYYGFDFYSPVYVDNAYYDPFYADFYRPNTSIYYGANTAFVGTTVTGRPVFVNNVYRSPAWGYGPAFAGTGFSTFGGGFASPAGGFIGGYNAYCPPAIGSIYSAPVSGVFQPDRLTSTATTAAGTTRSSYYGPRSGGSTATSPRTQNPRTTSAPDRAIATSATSSTGRSVASNPRGTYTTATNSPRAERPSYTPPASVTRAATSRTRTAGANRYSGQRPSRSSYDGYRPASRSYSTGSSTRSSSATRSAFSRPSSSSTRSFSSPRSSSSARSSATRSASPRSGGSSPRGRN